MSWYGRGHSEVDKAQRSMSDQLELRIKSGESAKVRFLAADSQEPFCYYAHSVRCFSLTGKEYAAFKTCLQPVHGRCPYCMLAERSRKANEENPAVRKASFRGAYSVYSYAHQKRMFYRRGTRDLPRLGTKAKKWEKGLRGYDVEISAVGQGLDTLHDYERLDASPFAVTGEHAEPFDFAELFHPETVSEAWDFLIENSLVDVEEVPEDERPEPEGDEAEGEPAPTAEKRKVDF